MTLTPSAETMTDYTRNDELLCALDKTDKLHVHGASLARPRALPATRTSS